MVLLFQAIYFFVSFKQVSGILASSLTISNAALTQFRSKEYEVSLGPALCDKGCPYPDLYKICHADHLFLYFVGKLGSTNLHLSVLYAVSDIIFHIPSTLSWTECILKQSVLQR